MHTYMSSSKLSRVPAARAGHGSFQRASSRPVLVEVLEPRLLMDGVPVIVGPPSFTAGPDQIVGENFPAQTVPNWATNIAGAVSQVVVGPRFYASGADQPQLTAVMYDSGGVINDASGTPMIFTPYIDTGSSGFVISHITAYGFYMTDLFGEETFVPGLGIGTDHGSLIGAYTDAGIGGPETGDVTSPLGLEIRNGTPLEATIDPETFEIIPPVINLAEFSDYGSYNLWARRQEGYGEHMIVLGFDLGVEPMDVVGMPVIGSSVMVMDPTTIGVSEDGLSITRMDTQLLPKGSATPAVNVTFNLRMADFVGATPAPGETFPSHARNPMFDDVTVSSLDGTAVSTGNSWLFDTGSTSTMISFAKAKELGLIDSSYASLNDFLADYTGIVMPIGGVGSITEPTYAPIMELGSVSIPAADGTIFTWNDVDVLVVDAAGLDGVFGLNLLLPASTIDLTDPLNPIEVGENPGYFDKIVFDAHADNTASLGLFYSPLGGYTPPSPPVLSFQVTNDNSTLFAVQPAISADGTLTYTPAAGACGNATVTAVLTDARPEAAGMDQSAPLAFGISVRYPGDANGSGLVDMADYVAWFNGFGQTGATWTQGDFNGDGIVDMTDYITWFSNYGDGVGGSSASAQTPEGSLTDAIAQGASGANVGTPLTIAPASEMSPAATDGQLLVSEPISSSLQTVPFAALSMDSGMNVSLRTNGESPAEDSLVDLLTPTVTFGAISQSGAPQVDDGVSTSTAAGSHARLGPALSRSAKADVADTFTITDLNLPFPCYELYPGDKIWLHV
ncbi:MAG: hypothetical protein ACE15C_06975 [Phycisphaerae bacterium]